jgi:hypothetical protein
MSPAPDGGHDLVVEGSLGRGSGHEKASGVGVFLLAPFFFGLGGYRALRGCSILQGRRTELSGFKISFK